jgi:putative DNA primase/helicase
MERRIMRSTKGATVASATEIIVPTARLNKFDFQELLRQSTQRVSHPFSLAVKAATAAYARTERMVDVALAYAAHGISVFPVSINTKTPIPARDKDANGEPIPGTGGFKKATTNPEQIRKWWWRNQKHLIGAPMGELNKIWTLDTDTTVEHDDDGVAALNRLIAEHGAIMTREHRTATDGLHHIFNWTADNPIGCSKGMLPNGLDVKGHGGYIVVPPSRRKGKSYTVSVDIDPADAPAWLYDLIGRRRPTNSNDGSISTTPDTESSIWDRVGMPPSSRNNEPFANVEDLCDALQWIPNNLDWNEWSNHGLAIWAATNGQGLDLWIEFSSKSPKYNEATTLARWNGISGSPPNRTGAYYILSRAIAHGWKRAPTYQAPKFNKNETAREEIRRVVRDFLKYDKRRKNPFEQYGEQIMGSTAIVWAERIDTGLGKTKITIGEVAQEVASSSKCFVYTVPTLKLGEDIERQFRALGVSAKLFRGREADDLDTTGAQMCLDLDKVAIAFAAGQDITASCCKHKEDVCPFFNQCGYQRQKVKGIRVWITATDILFHEQPALGKLNGLIIDETFWEKSLRGVDDNERWEISLASLSESYRAWRRILAFDFFLQEEDGGIQRSTIENMEPEFLNDMIAKEYRHMPELGLRPGMSRSEYKWLQKNKGKLINQIVFAKRIIKILKELRHMVKHPEIKASGRLQLMESSTLQQRVITWRSVDTIKDQFQISTLLIDATLLI